MASNKVDSLDLDEYEKYIVQIRDIEYPMLRDAIYLDHAGTTLYSRRLIEQFSAGLVTNLYGNPHSFSTSSQFSTHRIEAIRSHALRYFKADPAYYDLIFVANATAGIKLVMECFRDSDRGFWYGYHRDSHTSLVGIREAALDHQCFETDTQVRSWIQHRGKSNFSSQPPELFAYPAQSNMNGRRLPLDWCRQVRSSNRESSERYTLLDAAAFASTSQLDLTDYDSAPDFTVLSFYKIFGLPDLGALIVRKDSAEILMHRRYFGGGTVDMALCLNEQWHIKKTDSIHEALEDGTLPIHNIVALGIAMETHKQLFGSGQQISRHANNLASRLYHGMMELKHFNHESLCYIYEDSPSGYGDPINQGPVIAFNLRDSAKNWISNAEVEKLATIRNIHLRSGGLCNPGGIASYLSLAPWEMKQNFSAGLRCGMENDTFGQKPSGALRVSLGAMSTYQDVDTFLEFLREFFVEQTSTHRRISRGNQTEFFVESLMVYPIKSCAGWKVPPGHKWEVRKEGLAWDREWCILNQASGAALSQKQYPKMALITPSIDFHAGVLRIRYNGPLTENIPNEVTVPLSADPTCFDDLPGAPSKDKLSSVCGDRIIAKRYTSSKLTEFFSSIIGIPCQLARFPSNPSTLRYGKSATSGKKENSRIKSLPNKETDSRPILFSNESPILTISRSSLNFLNEQIKARGGKAAEAAVFRANIVVAQKPESTPGTEQPYAEDDWSMLQMGDYFYEILGPCRRCQVVCVDQFTAVKDEEPFVTLAKTRRFAGKVWFGMHTCHLPVATGGKIPASASSPMIAVGDDVTPFT